MTAPSVAEASRTADQVLDHVGSAVVGKRRPLELVLATILAGGHVLMEDFPGLGKTLAARSIAQTLGLQFTRAQFTPDMLPADLTGSYVYDQAAHEFDFRKGPLFTGLLLADEINRTPPKTQAALLEAMQEHQVSVEGRTFALPRPFHVLATANPVEYEGTYPLPEAQLDRFLCRVSFGYPTVEEENEVVHRRIARQQEDQHLPALLDAGGLLALQRTVEQVSVEPTIVDYCVRLAQASREHTHLQIGASPRGSLGLVLVGRSLAVIRGRDYVVPEDIKAVAQSVLAHRVSLRPELWMTDHTAMGTIRELLEAVPVPPTAGGPVSS